MFYLQNILKSLVYKTFAHKTSLSNISTHNLLPKTPSFLQLQDVPSQEHQSRQSRWSSQGRPSSWSRWVVFSFLNIYKPCPWLDISQDQSVVLLGVVSEGLYALSPITGNLPIGPLTKIYLKVMETETRFGTSAQSCIRRTLEEKKVEATKTIEWGLLEWNRLVPQGKHSFGNMTSIDWKAGDWQKGQRVSIPLKFGDPYGNPWMWKLPLMLEFMPCLCLSYLIPLSAMLRYDAMLCSMNQL